MKCVSMAFVASLASVKPRDRYFAQRLSESSYLGTSRFAIKKYDPCTKTVTVLRGGLPK